MIVVKSKQKSVYL